MGYKNICVRFKCLVKQMRDMSDVPQSGQTDFTEWSYDEQLCQIKQLWNSLISQSTIVNQIGHTDPTTTEMWIMSPVE